MYELQRETGDKVKVGGLMKVEPTDNYFINFLIISKNEKHQCVTVLTGNVDLLGEIFVILTCYPVVYSYPLAVCKVIMMEATEGSLSTLITLLMFGCSNLYLPQCLA